jgi:putative Holliday junction resolvase
VLKFAELNVVLMDERFTSKMAVQAMIAGGMKKKDRQVKGNIDKISAAIVLQSYLSANNQ